MQYAAWGGGELRDSASRNYNAPFTAPVLRGSSSERPPRRCLRALRLGSLYPNKIRGRRFLKESRYSLSVQADEACGAKSNVSCVPPLREAAGGCGPRDPLGRKSNTSFTAQSCRVRPVAHPPPKPLRGLGDKAGDSANRAIRSQPKARPSSPPRVSLTAAPLALRRFLPSPAAILAGLAECQPAEYAL